jgi:hypothetical protein
MFRQSKILAVTALLVSSCSSTNEDAECDGELVLTVSSAAPEIVSSALLVRGTAVTTRNVSVRSVNVAGVEAAPSSFNFRSWTATVPFDTLLALPADAKKPDEVEIPIDAVPACGRAANATVKVQLNRRPEIAVSTLVVSATYPGQAEYLPANGNASALLTITGNPEARGATVIVHATGEGQFSGGSNQLAVVLAGDGDSASMASALIKGRGEGSIYLNASALGRTSEPIKIDTAAAPKFFPPTAELIPGQTLIVLMEKRLAAQNPTCTVQADEGLTVVAAEDFSTFTLAAADDLAEEVQARLDCRDDYGQATSVTYTAAPKAPKP